ncbi:Siderophore iron transporter mirB [Tolypocladium ophioglossoides CBS 100239]|uniref:Siderophore iron transporter mirB n=1 Tax=Tolypocladium ophioglossoides (strain CBS 100239) TaxID=1163406 RepID=A0A0L0MYN1_TOLOC|nr:Siderophore iron transporter mirB [Tolypocladium ophioglossoides CBS 100239]
MAVFSKTRFTPEPALGMENAATEAAEPDKSDTKAEPQQDSVNTEKDEFHSDNRKQAGVKKIEAAATVWSKWHMIAAYTNIWLIYFFASIMEVVVRTLDPFVTSSFQKHSLTAAMGIISSIVGGLSKLAIAKILDTVGRPQGLALTLFLWVMGLVMMAACTNVETYAAAQVFSSTGAQGVSYCLTIFIADTTSLLNRPLMLAFATSPYIVTTWIGGPMANSVLAGPGWRWGFGVWAIVTPVVVLPLVALFGWNQHKAKEQGLSPESSTRCLSLSSIRDFAIEVDLIGLLLLAGGMALFLLPFALWQYQDQGWRSPMIICMIIFGGLLVIAFIARERFLAPVTFIPLRLPTDRTVFFAGLMFTFVFANSLIWGSFFTSMLLVVWNTGITKATYISNIYRVGSCASGLVLGYFLKKTGRFKWVAALYALPLMLLGVGLMIYFRRASQGIGYVIMTQIFVAFAGGPMVIAGEMAMMAPSEHQYIAVIIAILDLFAGVGNAIGRAISSAIWSGTFRDALAKRLPSDAPIDSIYGSLPIQLSYDPGSPERDAISDAYSESQRYMLITSTCFVAVGWVCTWLWRDIRLRDKVQVQGHVV